MNDDISEGRFTWAELKQALPPEKRCYMVLTEDLNKYYTGEFLARKAREFTEAIRTGEHRSHTHNGFQDAFKWARVGADFVLVRTWEHSKWEIHPASPQAFDDMDRYVHKYVQQKTTPKKLSIDEMTRLMDSWRIDGEETS